MLEEKSGTCTDSCAEEGNPKRYFKGNKYTLHISGVIEYTNFIRTLAYEPVQGKPVPWKGREHGIIKRQYADYQKGGKKNEKVDNYKKIISCLIDFSIW